MRKTALFNIDNPEYLKQQLLFWAAAHEYSAYLDSNSNTTTWDCLAAAGAHRLLERDAGNAFDFLKKHLDAMPDWWFGFLAYDLKNEIENLRSANLDGLGFPDLLFFQPEAVAGLRNGMLEIQCLNQEPEAVWAEIKAAKPAQGPSGVARHLKARMPKQDYLSTVAAIREHIVAGDLYEMNLCQEFYEENVELDPLAIFLNLNALSQAPFATYLRCDTRYLMCGSPERFLKKTGAELLSQPIKGTRPRGRTEAEDAQLRAELSCSEKDRAENVMIVDLVRNDLARNCLPGSVKVSDLFGIHTFETVHQMISSVHGTLRPEVHPLDALRDAFPMGSMTGAPKVMAMDLIEHYERSRRGLFSGAVGYFDPSGNFDFNVVIRSVLYNAIEKYVSVQVGGAIVFDSEPEHEYEECLLKARAMRQALGFS